VLDLRKEREGKKRAGESIKAKQKRKKQRKMLFSHEGKLNVKL